MATLKKLTYALTPKWTTFAVWTLIVGLVAGVRLMNNSLFNQMSQWTVIMSETYRVFTNPNCDRNAGAGCPSTVAVAIPQRQISGATIFLWIFFLPGAVFFVHALHSFYHAKNNAKLTPVERRQWEPIVFAGITTTELFVFIYIRVGLGDSSLYSNLYASGLWAAMRVYMANVTASFLIGVYNTLAYPVAPVSKSADPEKQTKTTGTRTKKEDTRKEVTAIHWLVHWAQLVCEYCLWSAPMFLFWAPYWTLVANAFSSTRSTYVMASALWFSLQMVQDLATFGLGYYYFTGVRLTTMQGTAYKEASTAINDRKPVVEFGSYVVNISMTVMAIWLIKVFATVFPMMYSDASVGNTIPYLLST